MGRFPSRGPMAQCCVTHYCSGQRPAHTAGSWPTAVAAAHGHQQMLVALSRSVQSSACGTSPAVRGCGQVTLGGGPQRGARQGIRRRAGAREWRDRGRPHRRQSLVDRNGEQEQRRCVEKTTAHGGMAHLARLRHQEMTVTCSGTDDR
jgi:hypothetical protein